MKIVKTLGTLFFLLTLSCHPNESPKVRSAGNNHAEVSQNLAFEFTPSVSSAQTWILIHGLGDDMRRLDGLAGLARAQGYSVLQMDLHGHGEKFFNYLRENPKMPDTFDYEQNVIDIEKLIIQLQIENKVVIVGHSYGGAIAYALAARLEKNGTASIHSVHLLAPYVQRIDKFLKSSYNPFRPPQIDQITDPLLDPVIDMFMEKKFRTYLKENYYSGRDELSADEESQLKLRIEAAIKCTKGIRHFDLLERSQPLIKFSAPLQIIGAKNDKVVTEKQLKAFDERLSEENILHTLQIIDDDTGHLFPRKSAEAVFNRIDTFR